MPPARRHCMQASKRSRLMASVEWRHETGRPACPRIGVFGTGIMQHPETFSPHVVDQMDLPEVGETVQMTERRAGLCRRIWILPASPVARCLP
jgi:hypothetical protein